MADVVPALIGFCANEKIDMIINAAMSAIDLKNEFTISAWVTASGGKAVKQRQILWYGDGRNGYDPYFLYYSANSTDTNPVFGISFDGYNGYRNSLEETISNGYGRLTLMTGTCRKNADGSKTLSMYIDGQLSHDYLVPASTSQISYDTSQMWMTIGACQDPYWQQFVGTIDDIRIYNRALSESEAVELYVQKRPYTVNFAAGTGGTLNGEANQIVGYHSDCTPVIAVPNPGYHFVNWTGTGGYTSTTPSIAVTNITLEMSFTATFAVDVGTYYISGTVSGAVQQGVTLTLSGAASSKITSGADGAFTFTASNGSYTVTPSLSGYTFTPSSRNIAISGKDVNGCDFVATKNTGIYSISGTVGGAIQEGVTITLSDALSSTTLSGADGKYSFTGLADGDYTVTPELSVYSFTPFSKDATITGADQLDVNFTATTMSIYGTISKSSFNASHKESAKKINGTNVQYSTDKFTIQATIQLPEAFDLTAIGEDTGFTFDFGFYSFSDILGNATKKKLNGAKGGSATFKITGDDKIKGKTITVEKVDLRWDKKKKLTIKITGTPISNSNTNVLDLSGSGDSTSITGKIDTFTLTFNSAGAGFDKVLPLLAFTGKKKTSYVKGNVSMKTFTLVNWSAKGKK